MNIQYLYLLNLVILTPSYWVKDLNIKAEATKLLEEKFNKKI